MRIVAIGFLLALGCFICSLSGCATAKTCVQPLTAQTAADVASVAACTTTGESLAQCEDAQIAMETGQLTQDVLMCAETAVAAAVNGKHMASNSSYATKNVESSGNPADLPPVNDNVSPFAGQKKKP